DVPSLPTRRSSDLLLLGYLYARRDFEHQAELRHHYRRSMQDPLTGLPNRRGAMAAINHSWFGPTDHSHAVLLVDIDNFKSINDSSGHQIGEDRKSTRLNSSHVKISYA